MEDIRHPSRIIIGGDGNHHRVKALRHLLVEYGLPILVTSRKDAELIHYAVHMFLATKISFINQLAQICEGIGSDIQIVARGMGMDPRIGQASLTAGIGFGGSLSKDLETLINQGKSIGVDMPLLKAVSAVNNGQREWIGAQLKKQWGTLSGRRLAAWGITFKGGTEDIDESAAVLVLEHLLEEGLHLHIFDPHGMKSLQTLWESNGILSCYGNQVHWQQDKWGSLENADGLVILTDWQEFREIDLQRLKEELRRPLVIDGRNLFYPDMMKQLGIQYISVGRKV